MVSKVAAHHHTACLKWANDMQVINVTLSQRTSELVDTTHQSSTRAESYAECIECARLLT